MIINFQYSDNKIIWHSDKKDKDGKQIYKKKAH